MGRLKIQKREYLENGNKEKLKRKSELVPQMKHLISHRFVPKVALNSVRKILSWLLALHFDWISTALKSS